MNELSNEDLKLITKDISKFKKYFASGIQQAYQDNTFRLSSLTLSGQDEGFLHFNFEYKGQCSLYPGDGKHSDKVSISELTSPGAFFQAIDRIISQRVSESFIKVR
ncbi:hypothetical protein [Pectobacterium versatile]|uniref:hypothetical protein n=1 Tax=Pectobacterium versatile TaxID=2488639 RepID=UPI001CCEC539|nr:hypothetical protein [Pectobacterium versatile]